MISSEEMQHSCHMDWLKNELYMMYRHENNNVSLNYTIHIYCQILDLCIPTADK